MSVLLFIVVPYGERCRDYYGCHRDMACEDNICTCKDSERELSYEEYTMRIQCSSMNDDLYLSCKFY